MSSDSPDGFDPQAVRSNARGKRFVVPLLAAWPIGLAGGLIAHFLGAGLAVAIGGGLAVALGLSFIWVAVTFAIDDGDVEEHLQDEVARERAEDAPQKTTGPRS